MKKPDSSVNVCWCFDEHKFRRPNSTSQRARAQNTEANQKWIVTENVNQFRCVVLWTNGSKITSSAPLPADIRDCDKSWHIQINVRICIASWTLCSRCQKNHFQYLDSNSRCRCWSTQIPICLSCLMWCMIEMICVVIILSKRKQQQQKLPHFLIDTVALQLQTGSV